MVQTFDLNDKTVLITGGYGYLGKAVTESLVYHGGTVYVLARSEEKYNQAFLDHPENGKKLFFAECDISNTQSVKSCFRKIADDTGNIDVLINNAFYLSGQDPLAMTDEEWGHGIEGTLNSAYRTIREVIPYLKKSNAPRIINVSSMYGMVAPDFSVYDESPRFLNPPHYGAAKAGIIQLSRYYASFLGHEGITVNSVTPGPYPSKKVQKDQGFIEALEQKTCLKRIGQPKDLAGAFVYLASDAAGYVTGQNIIVDGGWTAT